MGIIAKEDNGFSRQVDAFFNTSLRKLNLTKEQIDQQDEVELHRSLSVIEDAIAKAESFGVCKLQITATMSVIVKSSNDAHFEVGIMPHLLEAKIRILSRLQEFGINSQEEEKSLLHQQVIKYRSRWLFSIGVILWSIGGLLIWKVPIWINLQWIIVHKSYIAISMLLNIILAGALWVFLDKNKSRRSFAVGSIVIAGIMGIAALL